MRQITATLALVVSLLLPQTAAAENLVVNGGFETGDFTGWSHTNSDNFAIRQYEFHSGKWALWFCARDRDEVREVYRLSQTFATIPGQSYEVSLWKLGGSSHNSLKMYWGGIEIISIDNYYETEWKYRLVSSPQVGTGATTTLEIVYDEGIHNQDFFLDDIQVKPVQNLVVNGNFETGDFTGWSRQDDLNSLFVDYSEPFDGKFSVHGTGKECRLSQTLTTIPGQSYRVSFWRKGGALNSNFNYLQAYWNGAPIPSINEDSGVQQYSFVSSTQVAHGSSTLLEFVYDSGWSGWTSFYLDNVQVNPVSAITAPRPGKPQSGIQLLLLE